MLVLWISTFLEHQMSIPKHLPEKNTKLFNKIYICELNINLNATYSDVKEARKWFT